MSEKEPALAWHSTEFYRTAPSARRRVSFIQHKGKRIVTGDFSHSDLELVKPAAA